MRIKILLQNKEKLSKTEVVTFVEVTSFGYDFEGSLPKYHFRRRRPNISLEAFISLFFFKYLFLQGNGITFLFYAFLNENLFFLNKQQFLIYRVFYLLRT